jgi:hypothetical protein
MQGKAYDRISRVASQRHTRNEQSIWGLRWKIFRGVYGDFGPAIEHRLLNLLDEDSLTANISE